MPVSLEEGGDVQPRWRLQTKWQVDWSTWEFGFQLRIAGRWKRGAVICLGPIRGFVGWEKRYPGMELRPVGVDSVGAALSERQT